MTLKSNDKNRQFVIVLLWIMLILEILTSYSGYIQLDLLQSMSGGLFISEERASANDLREGIIALLYSITYLLTAIAFIRWFRRAYFNLHQQVDHLKYAEGWAAGAWFVPFVNLFRPYQIMKELYTETRKLLSGYEERMGEILPTRLLGWWWVFWLISNFISQISLRISFNAEWINDLITSTSLSLIASMLRIPLTILTIFVVEDYAKIESLMMEDEELIAELPIQA